MRFQGTESHPSKSLKEQFCFKIQVYIISGNLNSFNLAKLPKE